MALSPDKDSASIIYSPLEQIVGANKRVVLANPLTCIPLGGLFISLVDSSNYRHYTLEARST